MSARRSRRTPFLEGRRPSIASWTCPVVSGIVTAGRCSPMAIILTTGTFARRDTYWQCAAMAGGWAITVAAPGWLELMTSQSGRLKYCGNVLAVGWRTINWDGWRCSRTKFPLCFRSCQKDWSTISRHHATQMRELMISFATNLLRCNGGSHRVVCDIASIE
jgi:hypothetical protein